MGKRWLSKLSAKFSLSVIIWWSPHEITGYDESIWLHCWITGLLNYDSFFSSCCYNISTLGQIINCFLCAEKDNQGYSSNHVDKGRNVLNFLPFNIITTPVLVFGLGVGWGVRDTYRVRSPRCFGLAWGRPQDPRHLAIQVASVPRPACQAPIHTLSTLGLCQPGESPPWKCTSLWGELSGRRGHGALHSLSGWGTECFAHVYPL